MSNVTNNDTNNEQCSLCQKEDDHEAWHTTSCKHTFHKTCIKKWFKKHRLCPNCLQIDDCRNELDIFDQYLPQVLSETILPPFPNSYSTHLSPMADMIYWGNWSVEAEKMDAFLSLPIPKLM